MIRILTILIACLGLGACASLLVPKESSSIYRLPSAPAAAASATQVPWQLSVDAPQAPPLIDSEHILVLPRPEEINVYKGARWAAPVPQMVRQRLLDAFTASGRVLVSQRDIGLDSDYLLYGMLPDFQSEYRNGAPVVHIRYEAKLIDADLQRVIAARSFDVTQAPSGTGIDSVVAAFGRAMDTLSARIVAWTLSQGQKDWPHNPDPDAPAHDATPQVPAPAETSD